MAQAIPPPTPPAPISLAEHDKVKADLETAQTENARLTKIANGLQQQRNAESDKANNAQLQLAIANETIQALSQKVADLQSKYDLEIAKTGALLKEKGGNSAVTAKNAPQKDSQPNPKKE